MIRLLIDYKNQMILIDRNQWIDCFDIQMGSDDFSQCTVRGLYRVHLIKVGGVEGPVRGHVWKQQGFRIKCA